MAAIDYLGESAIGHSTLSQTPGWWWQQYPWFNSYCGDIDLIGDKKPQSYYRDVLWGRSQLEIAVQRPLQRGRTEELANWGWRDELRSWSWEGYEGFLLKVRVLSAGDRVKLMLNDKEIGEKPVPESGRLIAEFDVPYGPAATWTRRPHCATGNVGGPHAGFFYCGVFLFLSEKGKTYARGESLAALHELDSLQNHCHSKGHEFVRRFELEKCLLLFLVFLAGRSCLHAGNQALARVNMTVFNVKEDGATRKKPDNAGPAIQKAIDAAAAADGGVVYLPPGEYTSGTSRLRSHVNIYLESGATLFASEDPAAFDSQKVQSKDALFFGEDLEDISISGRGTVDGQAKYFWAPDTIEGSFLHKKLILASGKSQMLSYPVGNGSRTIYPHLIWLGRCKNVSIKGVSFVRSFRWTFAFYDCSRMVVDGIYIYTSLHEAVWADGIDIVSCKDVSISNSAIATCDDCIVFVCGIDEWGPTSPCEHITVTNCRLSSASAASSSAKEMTW